MRKRDVMFNKAVWQIQARQSSLKAALTLLMFSIYVIEMVNAKASIK